MRCTEPCEQIGKTLFTYTPVQQLSLPRQHVRTTTSDAPCPSREETKVWISITRRHRWTDGWRCYRAELLRFLVQLLRHKRCGRFWKSRIDVCPSSSSSRLSSSSAPPPERGLCNEAKHWKSKRADRCRVSRSHSQTSQTLLFQLRRRRRRRIVAQPRMTLITSAWIMDAGERGG